MKKNKNLAVFVIIVLLIGVVFVSVASKGFTQMDPRTWFKKGTTNEPIEGEVLAIDENGNKLTAGGNYSLPNRMTFLSASRATSVEDGILITAKFTPANATLIDLKWSVNWKEDVTAEQKAWTSGKAIDQIIKLTATDNTCRVNCLQAFGCPIIFKCESVANKDAYATCQLDYAKKITNFTPKLIDENDMPLTISNDTINMAFNKNAYLGFYGDYSSEEEKLADRDTWFTYSVGTVTDSYNLNYTVTLDSEVYLEGLCVEFNENGTGVQSKNFNGDVSLDIGSAFISSLGFAANGYDNDELMMAFGDCIESCQTEHVFDLTITLTGTYQTYSKTFTVNRSSWDYGIVIESIQLTKPSFTF